MGLPVIGGIVLGGVTLNTDPAVYEPLNWEKRYSVHKAIGGALTVQDFGTFMKDLTLRLQSAEAQFLDDSVVASLHSMFRTKAATYTLTDWLTNNFTVFIEKFVPVPFKKGRDRLGNTIVLYSYSMDLHVLVITTLLGVAYSGS